MDKLYSVMLTIINKIYELVNNKQHYRFIIYALHMVILLNITFCSDSHFSVPVFSALIIQSVSAFERHRYLRFLYPRRCNPRQNQ